VGKVRASIAIDALASEAEALWYETKRWQSFVDGLQHIVRVEGDWPHEGARVLWNSRPNGRGYVEERVTAYAAREGQTLAVEDNKIRGTQRITFTPTADGVIVELALGYELKEAHAAMAIVDLLFIRRQQRESLQRTLRRFRIELASERESSV
jgi:uncharacterized membrane protein